MTRRKETGSHRGVRLGLGKLWAAWLWVGFLVVPLVAEELDVVLAPPVRVGPTQHARLAAAPKPLPSKASQDAPAFSLPDLRQLHRRTAEAVGSLGSIVNTADDSSASSRFDPPAHLPAPSSQAAKPAPLNVSPWRDPTINLPLPLPLEASLPPLAPMPLVSFKPDTRIGSPQFRVTDEPATDDVSEAPPELELPQLPLIDAAKPPVFHWPETPKLISMLERLEEYPQTEAWAHSVHASLKQLHESTIGAPESTQVLKQLQETAAEAQQLSQHLEYGWARTDLSQTYFALIRRLDLWNAVHEIVANDDPRKSAKVHSEVLLARLDAAEQLLRDGGQLLSWSDYLGLKQLREAIDGQASAEQGQRIVAQVLSRMQSPAFDADQRELMSRGPMAGLATALRPWLGIEFQPEDLLAAVERYEAAPSAADAREVALQASLLQHHETESIAALGEQLDHTYRNANARIEVGQALMQAFLPELEADEEPVDDFVLGNRVRGRSRKTTQLQIRPVPDSQQWRVQLEVVGQVDSRTSSSSGPITVFNRGRSRFHAAKQVVINSQGFWVSPAVARASTNTDIDDLQSDFDGIPLIGSLVRNVARGQTQDKQYQAEQEVEQKIRQRAEGELDAQLNEKVQHWQDLLYAKLMEPLGHLGLEPAVVDLTTSSRSVSGRFRAAGLHQLAAHTPRPSAPADSVVNLQLHQSAINNMIRQLRLGGRKLTPEEFLREIGTRFPAIRQKVDEELPTDVVFEFAEEDPIRVEFTDGQAKLTLRLRSLQVGNDSWEDLEVSALYSPSSVDWDATIARESTVFLQGRRLGFRDQLALRAVFLKVLSKKHQIRLFPAEAASDPRLAEFQVNQLALHEGWFALSLGPASQQEPSRRGPFRIADEALRRQK